MIDDSLKKDRDALLDYLRPKKGCRIVSPRKIFCPYHENVNTTAAWTYKTASGAWRYKCAGCGLNEDIFGLKAKDEGVERNVVLVRIGGDPKKKQPQPLPPDWPTRHEKDECPAISFETLCELYPQATLYPYKGHTSKEVEAVIVRQDFWIQDEGEPHSKRRSKQIDQWSWDADRCQFVNCAWKSNRPLFHTLPLPTDDTPVIVVEGEKCVMALADVGICAITSLGGSSPAPELSDWSYLDGLNVLIWPDFDPERGMADGTKVRVGQKRADTLLEFLTRRGKCRSVYTLDVSKLPVVEKEDAAEAVDRLALEDGGIDGVADRLWVFIDNAINRVKTEDEDYFERLGSGTLAPIPSRFPLMAAQTNFTGLGGITVLNGVPGSSKTFFVLDQISECVKAGVKFAMYAAEMSRMDFAWRLIAQRAGRSECVDPAWRNAHRDEAKRLYYEHEKANEPYMAGIWVRSAGEFVGNEKMIAWAKERAAEGCRFIVIDPVTAITGTGKAKYERDQEFVLACEGIARENFVNIMLVTHPNDTGKNAQRDMSHTSGGKAYQFFSCNILLIETADPKDCYQINGCEDHVNRIIISQKNRNGKASPYTRYGCSFDHKYLSFIEHGVIDSGPNKKKEPKETAKQKAIDRRMDDGADIARRMKTVVPKSPPTQREEEFDF